MRFWEGVGWTQVELADALGITPRKQLEGKLVPNIRLDTLEQLAKVLHVKPDSFLKGK